METVEEPAQVEAMEQPAQEEVMEQPAQVEDMEQNADDVSFAMEPTVTEQEHSEVAQEMPEEQAAAEVEQPTEVVQQSQGLHQQIATIHKFVKKTRVGCALACCWCPITISPSYFSATFFSRGSLV